MTDPYHNIPGAPDVKKPAEFFSMTYWRLNGAPWCSPFGPVCDTAREAMEYAQEYRIPIHLGPADPDTIERVLYMNEGKGWVNAITAAPAPFEVT